MSINDITLQIGQEFKAIISLENSTKDIEEISYKIKENGNFTEVYYDDKRIECY